MRSARSPRSPATPRARARGRRPSAESVTDSGRLAPGIGIITGLSASSHASTTCCGETPCASAISRTGSCAPGASAALEMPPNGDQGRNAIPCRSHSSTSPLPIGEPYSSESWFCTETRSTIARVSSIWSDVRVGDPDPADLALVLELLERADRLRVGHGRDRGGGTGRGRSGRSRARCSDCSQARLMYSGRPSSSQPPSAVRVWPPLVATITPSRRPSSALAISRSLWPKSVSSAE